MRFRKKPVVIEAVQVFTREGAKEMPGICTGGPDCPGHGPDDAHPHVHTLEGDHTWTPGDWLITGVKGERYFCKPDIFAATYEPVAAPRPGEGECPLDEVCPVCSSPEKWSGMPHHPACAGGSGRAGRP